MVLAHAQQTKALLSTLIFMKKPNTDEEKPITVTGKNAAPMKSEMLCLIRGLLRKNN
jgi:hypothetical protein